MSIFKITFSIPFLFLLTTVMSNNSIRLSRIHISISGKDHHKPKALISLRLLAVAPAYVALLICAASVPRLTCWRALIVASQAYRGTYQSLSPVLLMLDCWLICWLGRLRSVRRSSVLARLLWQSLRYPVALASHPFW